MRSAVRVALPRLRMLHYLLVSSEANQIMHCLDVDIAASAPNRAEAQRRLDVLVKNYIECALNTGNYSMLSTPAPAKYWDMFKRGTKIEPANQVLEVRVPDVVPTPNIESKIPVLAFQALAA